MLLAGLRRVTEPAEPPGPPARATAHGYGRGQRASQGPPRPFQARLSRLAIVLARALARAPTRAPRRLRRRLLRLLRLRRRRCQRCRSGGFRACNRRRRHHLLKPLLGLLLGLLLGALPLLLLLLLAQPAFRAAFRARLCPPSCRRRLGALSRRSRGPLEPPAIERGIVERDRDLGVKRTGMWAKRIRKEDPQLTQRSTAPMARGVQRPRGRPRGWAPQARSGLGSRVRPEPATGSL